MRSLPRLLAALLLLGTIAGCDGCRGGGSGSDAAAMCKGTLIKF